MEFGAWLSHLRMCTQIRQLISTKLLKNGRLGVGGILKT